MGRIIFGVYYYLSGVMVPTPLRLSHMDPQGVFRGAAG